MVMTNFDDVPITKKILVDQLDKVTLELAQLRGNIFAEIDNTDAVEGQDYRLTAIWASMKNITDRLNDLKWRVHNSLIP
jgi:hypothetical protein